MKNIFSLQLPYYQNKVSFFLFFFLITCISRQIHAQRVGVGLNNPAKLFSVNGSILLDQNNTSNGVLDSAALVFGTQGGVGIAAKKTLGGLQNGLQFYTNNTSRINIGASGYVGISVASPTALLHVGGDIRSNADIRALGTGQFDESLIIGSSGFAGYKLSVNNGNSYFQGNGYFTGALTSAGVFSAPSLDITGNAAIGQNATVGSNLTVTNDGIINGNFRVDGRIGINGYTNANYGLIVNNANTYLQGATTISGNTTMNANATIGGSASIEGNASIAGSTNLQGPVTIQGKGSVRSDGTSPLRIGFSSVYTGHSYGGHDEWAVTVNIADFGVGNSNVRVMIAQFDATDAYAGDVSNFKWYVYDIDPDTDTCKIRIINESGLIKVLQGTFYLMAVAKD